MQSRGERTILEAESPLFLAVYINWSRLDYIADPHSNDTQSENVRSQLHIMVVHRPVLDRLIQSNTYTDRRTRELNTAAAATRVFGEAR